jgi:DNA polymerase-3 subunit beta
MLVSALSRALSERVSLLDMTIGRKGLLGYLKAVDSSNIIKVTPSNGSASGSQAADKKLKVICGANTSYLKDGAWIKEPSGKGKGKATPFTLCEVRVSPNNSVNPNVGATELAEALNRVLPFTARDGSRPVLACVNFVAKDGKLTLVSSDGFRLGIVTLDYDDGEGQALVSHDDLAGIANALRKAKRARISFEPSGSVLDGKDLILDTELIRYKWTSLNGSYPDWQKLIPTEFKTVAHFDTVEAMKAVNSLKALADSKAYPVDLSICEGKMAMVNPDDKGQTEVVADTEGEASKVRIDGRYLAQAFKACGGLVDFKVSNGYSPTLFSTNGYRLVVVPMITAEASEQARRDREAKAEQGEPVTEKTTETTGVVAEAEKIARQAQSKSKKRKHSRTKEPVAVA